MITRSLGAARKFLAEHGEIVLKPLRRAGGVFKIGGDGFNLTVLMDCSTRPIANRMSFRRFFPRS
jgi:glutathione synthase